MEEREIWRTRTGEFITVPVGADLEELQRAAACARSVQSIFNMFCPREVGTAEIDRNVVDGRAPCNIMLQSQPSVYDRMNVLSESPKLLASAKIGESVLVQDQKKGFVRGVVVATNKSGYLVGLIDYGKVVHVRRVYSTTDYLRKIISFGGVITFTGNESSQAQVIKFRVKGLRPLGIWVCDVLESDANDISEVVLEEWVPPLATGSIRFEPGCTVVITQPVNGRTMYVRRIDGPWNKGFIRFNNDITIHCLKAAQYKTVPNRGEICCARYEKDGGYYRAAVRWAENNLAVISFMDFGTEQLTDVSDLRYLPSLTKKALRYCQPVKLKDVSLESTPQGIDYIKMLTSCQRELILAESSSNGVVFIDRHTRENVNKILCSFEISEWGEVLRASLRTGEIYTIESVGEVTFSCGSTEDVLLLNFDETNLKKYGAFWATLNSEEFLDNLNGELRDQMIDFCLGLEKYRYLPRKGELCIVKYKGEWRRALCLDEKNVICKVTFIDYGVTTWTETRYIRKIIRDFLEMPALALKCSVSGISNMSATEKENLISFMNKMKGKVIPAVEIVKRSDGIYYLSLDEHLKSNKQDENKVRLHRKEQKQAIQRQQEKEQKQETGKEQEKGNKQKAENWNDQAIEKEQKKGNEETEKEQGKGNEEETEKEQEKGSEVETEKEQEKGNKQKAENWNDQAIEKEQKKGNEETEKEQGKGNEEETEKEQEKGSEVETEKEQGKGNEQKAENWNDQAIEKEQKKGNEEETEKGKGPVAEEEQLTGKEQAMEKKQEKGNEEVEKEQGKEQEQEIEKEEEKGK